MADQIKKKAKQVNTIFFKIPDIPTTGEYSYNQLSTLADNIDMDSNEFHSSFLVVVAILTFMAQFTSLAKAKNPRITYPQIQNSPSMKTYTLALARGNSSRLILAMMATARILEHVQQDELEQEYAGEIKNFAIESIQDLKDNRSGTANKASNPGLGPEQRRTYALGIIASIRGKWQNQPIYSPDLISSNAKKATWAEFCTHFNLQEPLRSEVIKNLKIDCCCSSDKPVRDSVQNDPSYLPIILETLNVGIDTNGLMPIEPPNLYTRKYQESIKFVDRKSINKLLTSGGDEE
jgi:hypothetical protein